MHFIENKYIFIICSIIILLYHNNILLAQRNIIKPEDFIVTKWTSEQGLPQNSITDIYQTDDGYLWLSTYGGLVRFDGIKFVTYDASSMPEMRSSRVKVIIPFENNSLILILETGAFVLFDNKRCRYFHNIDELFEYSLSQKSIDKGIIKNKIGKWTKEGFFWYNNINVDSLNILNKETGLEYKNLDKIIDDTLWSISNAKLYFSSMNNTKTSPFKNEKSENFMILNTNGDYLTGILDYGLYYYNGKIKYFHTGGFGSLFKDIKTDFKFIVLSKDNQGNYWNSKNTNYLYFHNGKFIKFEVSKIHPGYPVNKIYIDNEGNMWFGTDGGLLRLKRKRILTYSIDKGLNSKVVRSIAQDKMGNILVATSKSIQIFRNGKFTDYKMPFMKFWCVYPDSKGKIWFGSIGKGVFSYSSNGFFNYKIEDGLAGNDVKAIYEDKAGNIWFGTTTGLSLLKKDKFYKFTISDGLCNDNIISLFEDSHNVLWIGTNGGGLSAYKNGEFKNYTTSDGLLNETIRVIFQDRSNTIWIGTYGGGIHKFKDGKFFPVTVKNSLFDNNILNIFETDSNDFWISSNKGLFSVKSMDLSLCADGKIDNVFCISITKKDGLLIDEFNGGVQPSYCRTLDNELWYPTLEGIAILNLNNFMINNSISPVKIESFRADDSIYTTEKYIEITHEKNNFQFDYTAICLSDPNKIKIKYKLDGFDNYWIEADMRRTAFYTNLLPGRYTFKVIACNNDGIWNFVGDKFTFEILPFWATTIWAYLFYFAVIISLFVFYLRYRIKKNERNIEIIRQNSKKYIDLQEKERKRISRELHDSVNQNIISANMKLKNIRNNAVDDPTQESIKIEKLLDNTITEISNITHDLHPIILDNLGFIRAVFNLCSTFKERTGIDYEIISKSIPKHLPQEMEINMYRIVQESLNNIEKHSKSSKVLLNFSLENLIFKIIIKDNGAGFDVNLYNQRQNQKLKFGIRNMLERVNFFNGKMQINSKIGSGTEIVITIPYNLKRNNFE